ncbi:hypothetical protein [Acetobacter sp.]|uniref:hypothetical protein n=1 Tax=Acetobacter sp. TaxID=440 RepID=UPI0039E91083
MPENSGDGRLTAENNVPAQKDEDLDGSFMPPIEARVEAWLVHAAGREKWVTADDPTRFRGLGYSITPLVEESEVPRVAEAAVAQVRKDMLTRHADDLRLLATIVERLKTIVTQGYEYDNAKIRGDLVRWGLIEPASPAQGAPIETPVGRRLRNVLALEWFATKIKWKTD